MRDFFESDGSGMVDVKVLEGLLKVLFGKALFRIDTCDKELSVIDMSRAISINDPHEELNSLLTNIFPVLKSFKQFTRLNDTIIILIEFLKNVKKKLLFITGQQLGYDISVYDSFEFVFELG
jgi:hypothetical protein